MAGVDSAVGSSEGLVTVGCFASASAETEAAGLESVVGTVVSAMFDTDAQDADAQKRRFAQLDLCRVKCGVQSLCASSQVNRCAIGSEKINCANEMDEMESKEKVDVMEEAPGTDYEDDGMGGNRGMGERRESWCGLDLRRDENV